MAQQMAHHETEEAAQLWTAAQRGETETVRAIVQRVRATPEVERRFLFNAWLPALNVAVINHHAFTVNALTVHAEYLGLVHSAAWTQVVCAAAQFGNADFVRQQRQHFVAVDSAKVTIQSMLSAAARHGRANVVRELLAAYPTCVTRGAIGCAADTNDRVVLRLLRDACSSYLYPRTFFTSALDKWRKDRKRRKRWERWEPISYYY